LADPTEKQRRSKRLPVRIPVRVYGRTPDDHPFRDVTETQLISAHGGLIPLASNVSEGQTILVVNSLTEEERECRVVYVEPDHGSKNKIGVEFMEAKGSFWHVYPVFETQDESEIALK
jgi:hypothetical protein